MGSEAHSDDECFYNSGPKHLMRNANDRPLEMTAIDWDNKEHRRCIAACIVKGTYIMENDRIWHRTEERALAPVWWRSFHFVLVRPLVDDDSPVSFGAIFEHKPPLRNPSAPRYVVAFRGTMLDHPNLEEDMSHNAMVVANILQKSPRYYRAHQEVCTLAAKASHDGDVVWLTGHSLGASLALEVGRIMMAKEERNLPTILFNPPHVSLLPAFNMMGPSERVKKHLHTASYFVKAILGSALTTHQKRMEKLFAQLSRWAPELYVHESDPFSQGYIDYFKHRQQVKERFEIVAKSGMTLSYRDMFFSLLGKEKERPHLLPSATLWSNKRAGYDAARAHGIKQWWREDSDLDLTCTQYSCPRE